MARVGEPDPGAQPQPPAPPTPPQPPVAPDAATDVLEVPESALRAYAADLEFDYDKLNDSEREFLALNMANRYETQFPASDPNAAPEANPLIPTDDDEATRAAAPPGLTPGTPDGATTGDAAAGSGPAAASDGAPQPDAPVAPGAAGEGGAAVPEGAEPTVTVPGIGDVPLSQLVNELALARGIQPHEIDIINKIRSGEAQAPGAPQPPPPPGWPAPAPAPQPTYPPTPQGYPQSAQPPAQPAYTPPPADQWEDPNAYQAFTTLQAQFAQQAAINQQIAEQQQAIMYSQQQAQQDAAARAMEPVVTGFATDHSLSEDEMGGLLTQLQASGLPQAYAGMHPGDPASATRAALNALYWSIPQYRDKEFQSQIAAHVESTKSAEQKKAEQGAIVSPAGSTSRTAPPPKTPQDRTQAMAAVIAEAQNGQTPGS